MNLTINSLTATELCQRMGMALKISRLNRCLTQAEVAHLTKCSLPTIKKIEAGNKGVAIIYIMRYIEITRAHDLIRGLDTIQQNPVFIKTKTKYSKRIRKTLKTI